MIPVPDSATAAEHAASLKLITQDAVSGIRAFSSPRVPK
jgi:hypothetical protein